MRNGTRPRWSGFFLRLSGAKPILSLEGETCPEVVEGDKGEGDNIEERRAKNEERVPRLSLREACRGDEAIWLPQGRESEVVSLPQGREVGECSVIRRSSQKAMP